MIYGGGGGDVDAHVKHMRIGDVKADTPIKNNASGRQVDAHQEESEKWNNIVYGQGKTVRGVRFLRT
jgi:hypothetical protein